MNEIIARVKSKLTWAVEHNITPTLEAAEMKALLVELTPKPVAEPAKLAAVPAAEPPKKSGK